MIRSMTAFAAGKTATEWGPLGIELRSLNHRYLELSLRLPEELRTAEPALRELLSERLSRGKVDCSVKFRRESGSGGGTLELNQDLVRQLVALKDELSRHFSDASPAGIADWMRWPGLVVESEPDLSPLHHALSELAAEVTSELLRFRQREGEKLAATIDDRLTQVEAAVGRVREWMPEIREAQRNRFNERVTQLTQNVDSERLEQEIAILLQKLDVDEELDRLEAHVSEVRRSLGLDKPVGRRLDFLMQELNREANTLGSKSVDPRTTEVSVELKVLIEQMREQVQNIE